MKLTRRAFVATGIAGAAGVWACGKNVRPDGQRSSRSLVLDFYGLSAVVFSGSPLVLDVLMIDGMQTKLNQVHHPRLRTDRKHIDGSNPTKESGEEDVSFLEKLPFWDLKGHRVTLESPGAPAMTRVAREGGVPGPAPGTDPAAQADLSWLARMPRIPAAGKGRIDPKLMAESPLAGKVAARLRFTTGQASARFDSPFQNVVWRIASPGSSAVERAIGQLRLTIPVTTDSVTFNLEPLDGGPLKRVVLAPSPTGDTLVAFRNVPEKHKCVDSEVRNLTHFAAFYELLAPEDQSGQTPFPVCPEPACQLRCVGLGGEPVYCPTSEYDPPPPPPAP